MTALLDREEYRSRVLSVGELTAYIRSLLEDDEMLASVWVKGEISDFKHYQRSGHLYFSLKDETAVINCVMFRSRARCLRFVPESGMKVIALGYVSVFERSGRYQLYVEDLEPDGVGALYLQLLQLRQKLEKEGLFSPDRKRPLPKFARRVGVVTSADGAAFRDIVKVIRQRYPQATVILAHSSVQGESAPQEISRAIRALSEYGEIDVIIVGRGGGSLEDLWAFNTEEVVRAVSSCPVPVISAVGHEVDYSLCDLAADVRAATPTQAAQLAVPDVETLGQGIALLKKRMWKAMERTIDSRWQAVDYLKSRRIWQGPEELMRHQRLRLSGLGERLLRAVNFGVESRRHEVEKAGGRLDALSPLKVLGRGYAVVRKAEAGQVITSVEHVNLGETVDIILNEGRMTAEVRTKERGELWRKP